MKLEQEILNRMNRQSSHSAGYKQLVRELGLRGGYERRELEETLNKMVRRGELMQTGRDRYGLPGTSADRNLIAGRLSMHRDGFGFVLPESKELREKLRGDIFIAPNEIGNAMHGDRVLIEIGPIRQDARAEGRIIKIADRAHRTVVGTFHYGSRYNYVAPIDEKITQDVVIPPGAEIVQTEIVQEDVPEAEAEGAAAKDIDSGRPAATPSRSATPHRVLGKEAKRSSITDLEGVIVNVEITQFPTSTHNARGKIIEVLGYSDDFGVDVEIIIRKHHLPHTFPDDVLAEAAEFSEKIPETEIDRRRDWRKLPIVTIDGETARDFDDAVLVTRLANDNYELQVHIADVAHYVREGHPIDQEAHIRGTSVYFPDRAIPMLPLELSTNICSLRPEVDRLVLSCVMEIDHAGEIVAYELSEGIIRSSARMTYTKVHAILNDDDEGEGDPLLRNKLRNKLRKEYAALLDNLERMRELAAILNRKRRKRGSIDFDLPEPNIEFDEQGLMKGITRSERNLAHRLIEEFMLAANECVAAHLEQLHIASLYRIHEKPEARKIYDFETLAASFGYSLGVGALPIRRMQLKTDKRARHGSGRNAREVEIPQDVHITPRMYQKLTDKIAGKPEERILSYLMLRSLKQARYSEVNEGHFALAAPSYTHFTSPIRRYPDLIVHRILKDVLAESPSGHAAGTIRSPLAENVTDRGAGKPSAGGSAVDVVKGVGSPASSPWSKRQKMKPSGKKDERGGMQSKDKNEDKSEDEIHGPMSEGELHDIAQYSSLAERRADEAERELVEWKKIRFMESHIGDDFPALILSITKFGMFVELLDMFIEGLVPLTTMTGDRYTFRENTRQIIGERTKRQYSLGDRVQVLLDRIDHAQRKLQFALIEPEPAPKQRKKRG